MGRILIVLPAAGPFRSAALERNRLRAIPKKMIAEMINSSLRRLVRSLGMRLPLAAVVMHHSRHSPGKNPCVFRRIDLAIRQRG
jgi:hypothetical protein